MATLKCYISLGKQKASILKMVKLFILFHLIIPLPGIYPNKIKNNLSVQ